MRIVIVNPFDPLPSEAIRRGRYGQLAAHLLKRKHKVTWLTADFCHTSKRYRLQPTESASHDLEIIPVHVPQYGRNISVRRIVSHLAYSRGVVRALGALKDLQSVRAVIASIPPIEAGASVARVCMAAHIPLVLDMQDAWPQVLERAFPRPCRRLLAAPALWPWRSLLRRAVSAADALVAVSPEYLSYLGTFGSDARSIPQYVFPLGFDAEGVLLEYREADRRTDGPFVVSYIGTFGHFYDLETVIQAALLCQNVGIKFVLIGSGPKFEAISRFSTQLGLKNVRFEGHLPFEDAKSLLVASDIGLVPITRDWPPSIPNKVFDYLSLGIPIVSSIQGSISRTMEEHGFGVQYQAGDARSLANVLMALQADRQRVKVMARNGADYAAHNMNGTNIYSQYADILEQVVLAQRPPLHSTFSASVSGGSL